MVSSFGQKTNEIISRISALASIGQKSWKKLRWFFVQTMIPKRHFEINWPLVYSTCHLQGPLLKKFEFPTNSDQLTKHNKQYDSSLPHHLPDFWQKNHSKLQGPFKLSSNRRFGRNWKFIWKNNEWKQCVVWFQRQLFSRLFRIARI